jgi:hypothetical protein
MQYEPIIYRDFYDVPRMFVVRSGDKTFLFDCQFDEREDEYDTHYSVFLMPPLVETNLAGDWRKLASIAVRLLGKVPVSDVQFDASKRNTVSIGILAQFGV